MARRERKRDPFRGAQTTTATVVEQARVELHYDYDQVPELHREAVRRSALTIKPRLKRAAEDIFVIGGELRGVKARLPYGKYTEWLDVEFGLSERMAQRFVNVRERLGDKTDKLSVLPPSTLYLLAAPSTPDEAIEAVETRIDAGERIGVAYVKQIITDAKQQAHARPMADAVVDGEVIGSEIVDAERAKRTAAATRLDTILTQVFELLGEQPAQDWALLFRNGELSRIRKEIHQLRTEVRAQMPFAPETAKTGSTSPSE